MDNGGEGNKKGQETSEVLETRNAKKLMWRKTNNLKVKQSFIIVT